MVDSLIGFHAIEAVALHGSVLPENVPIFFLGVCNLKLIELGTGPDNGVVAVADVDDDALLLMPVLPLLLF